MRKFLPIILLFLFAGCSKMLLHPDSRLYKSPARYGPEFLNDPAIAPKYSMTKIYGDLEDLEAL